MYIYVYLSACVCMCEYIVAIIPTDIIITLMSYCQADLKFLDS